MTNDANTAAAKDAVYSPAHFLNVKFGSTFVEKTVLHRATLLKCATPQARLVKLSKTPARFSVADSFQVHAKILVLHNIQCNKYLQL